MKIVVGSTNPVKVGAARDVVLRIWPAAEITAVAVNSGVSAMPMSDEECMIGARNRARAALELAAADLAIGIEGGVHNDGAVLMLTAWTAIISRTGLESIGSSGRLLLPRAIAERVRSGEELGNVMDDILNEHNIKQKGGAVSALTGGLVLRQDALAIGVAYALGPFVVPGLFE